MSALCQKQTFCAVAKNRSPAWVHQPSRMARPSSNGMSEAISAKNEIRPRHGWVEIDTAPNWLIGSRAPTIGVIFRCPHNPLPRPCSLR